MTSERWVFVERSLDLEVSDRGNFRTFDTGRKRAASHVAGSPHWAVLTYKSAVSGRRTSQFTGRIVWEAFNGLLMTHEIIVPRNGDWDDPSLDNLELVTRARTWKEYWEHRKQQWQDVAELVDG